MNTLSRENKNQGGFASLPEISLTLAISTIVIMAALGIVRMSLDYFNISSERAKAELELSQATFFLQTFLGQAIDVRATTGSINGFNPTPANDGRVRAPRVFHTLGGTNTVAAFVRETGQDNAALEETAIFFQAPTTTTSGILYFDAGVAGGATPNQSAGPNDIYFGRLTEFESRTPTVSNGVVLGVEFRIVARTFINREDPAANWQWCPNGGGACSMPTAYRDLEKVIKVNLVNNLVPSSGGQRTFGKLYFYRFVPPTQLL